MKSIHFYILEQTRSDEDTALKAAGCKNLGGSNPSCSVFLERTGASFNSGTSSFLYLGGEFVTCLNF